MTSRSKKDKRTRSSGKDFYKAQGKAGFARLARAPSTTTFDATGPPAPSPSTTAVFLEPSASAERGRPSIFFSAGEAFTSSFSFSSEALFRRRKAGSLNDEVFLVLGPSSFRRELVLVFSEEVLGEEGPGEGDREWLREEEEVDEEERRSTARVLCGWTSRKRGRSQSLELHLMKKVEEMEEETNQRLTPPKGDFASSSD